MIFSKEQQLYLQIILAGLFILIFIGQKKDSTQKRLPNIKSAEILELTINKLKKWLLILMRITSLNSKLSILCVAIMVKNG